MQYALADELFPEDGMRDADALLGAQHSSGRYTGSFWPGGHAFSTDMQDEAAGFLAESLFGTPSEVSALPSRAWLRMTWPVPCQAPSPVRLPAPCLAVRLPRRFEPVPCQAPSPRAPPRFLFRQQVRTVDMTRTSPDASAPESLRPGTPDTLTSGPDALASAPDTPAAAGPAAAPRVALVGAHGFGARHLENLARLAALNLVELVAVADPRPPAEGTLAEGVATFASLAELLAAGPAPDVVILATPIQTHAPLALAAIAAGSDVYVEKPPMASLAQFNAVLSAAEEAGRLVQVGFQSLGSHALPALDRLVADGEIGEIRGVSAVGTWVRTTGYFKRSRWAGKRSLDGTDVVDGVATNALAHAVATGLRIAGAARAADVASVETDLYRAHPTESDDTSVIRVRTATGTVLLCALTLCADEQTAPSVTIHGTSGAPNSFTPRTG